jgi:hypothetical protein
MIDRFFVVSALIVLGCFERLQKEYARLRARIDSEPGVRLLGELVDSRREGNILADPLNYIREERV